MVIIKYSNYIQKCPFTKKVISKNIKICLFNEKQFMEFKNIILNLFESILPIEVIEIIIEKTGYKKLIGRFGKEEVTNWKKNTYKNNTLNIDLKKKIFKEENFENDYSYESEITTDSDSDY